MEITHSFTGRQEEVWQSLRGHARSRAILVKAGMEESGTPFASISNGSHGFTRFTQEHRRKSCSL